MKKFVLAAVLFAVFGMTAFAQNAEMPRLAVVEFTANISNEKTSADTVTVRNLVESQMVATARYQIISRADIDKLLENQKIQVSSISSSENIKKLQLENISYVVTGSVDAMGSDYAVTVRNFYMGKYEVTQKEWVAIMGSNPSNFKGDDLPVEQVSWNEAVEYCNKLSLKEGLTPAYRGSGDSVTCNFTASGYWLPTEAEWEYAAKGGKQGDYLVYEYAGSNSVDAAGWYKGNSGGRTHPAGAVSGSYRVPCGGSWGDDARDLRSAYRSSFSPSKRDIDLGFRLVRGGHFGGNL
jgi:hypothetical protein